MVCSYLAADTGGGGANLSTPPSEIRGPCARRSVLEKVFWFFEPVEGLGNSGAEKRVEKTRARSVQRLRSMLPLTPH